MTTTTAPFDPSAAAVRIDLDWLPQPDYRAYHRSGWAYVMDGLHRWADGTRASSQLPTVRLDAYVDRTFHWKRAELAAAGVIPHAPDGPRWAGIVHHTFDVPQGSNHAAQLVRVPEFLASLPSCVLLVTLSEHLATQLRSALAAAVPRGTAPPPVASLTHPTEPVPPSLAFRMAAFDGGLVQIGSWLRDAFAIYELPVPEQRRKGGSSSTSSSGVVQVRKLALRGRDMAPSFPPASAMDPPTTTTSVPPLFQKMSSAATDEFLHHASSTYDAATDGAPTAAELDLGEAPSPPAPDAELTSMSLSLARTDARVYRFALDMLGDMLAAQRSVRELPLLDDAAFDALLSRSAVFLKLTDASAVNTVLECIARNTPIFVNRLPATEEALTPGYPGFYDDLAHAGAVVARRESYERVTAFLSGMDKTRFGLDVFLRGLDAALAAALAASAAAGR